MNVGDLIQLNARVTLADNQIAENVFHVKILVTGTDAEVKDACVNYLDDIFANVAGIQSTSVQALDVLFRNITAGTPTETLAWDDYVGGTSTSAAQLPPAVSGLVTATTAVAKAVGRKYIAGIVADGWGGAGWEGIVLTVLAALALDWISDYADVISDVELHPVLRRSGAAAPIDFTEALVRSEAAYQRRRREGVGD